MDNCELYMLLGVGYVTKLILLNGIIDRRTLTILFPLEAKYTHNALDKSTGLFKSRLAIRQNQYLSPNPITFVGAVANSEFQDPNLSDFWS